MATSVVGRMAFIPVTSLGDPRLAAYANLRDAELAQRRDPVDAAAHGGLFIAEGELVLERLIRSEFATESVLLTPRRLESLTPMLSLLPPETPIFVAEPEMLNQVVGFNMHRGVLAIGRRRNHWPLERLAGLSGPLLVLEDLVNHDNLGGIFRNAAGLGGAGVGVLLSPRCADPLYRKSLRVSMGHVLSVPFGRAGDGTWPGDALATLHNAGWETWALTPELAAPELETAAGTRRTRIALLLGSEGPGLRDETQQRSLKRVRIPMPPAPMAQGGPIDSLNVAMAAGIGLYALQARGRPTV